MKCNNNNKFESLMKTAAIVKKTVNTVGPIIENTWVWPQKRVKSRCYIRNH